MKCKNCEKEFQPTPSNAMRGFGLYCSKECYFEYRRKSFTDGKPMGKKKKIYKFICKSCGKEFERNGHDKHNNKFCSCECSQKFRSGRNHQGYNKETIRCAECGNEILRVPSRIGKVKSWGAFCSHDCKAKWMSKHIRGENHPQWQGGKSFEPYCPLFNKSFKERVRAFFDYTCQLCGDPQGKEKLHVHHIVYNKQTCCDESPKMFVPLCRSCHTKTNHNRDDYMEKFTKLITEKHNSRSYFTVEEWNTINGIPSEQSLTSSA